MPSPSSISESYATAFSNLLEHAVQNEVQRVGDLCQWHTFTGESKILHDVEDMAFTLRSGRLQATVSPDLETSNRKLTKSQYYVSKSFHIEDEDLVQFGRPDSEVLQAMTFASRRLIDSTMLSAADATVKGGDRSANFDEDITANTALTGSGTGGILAVSDILDALEALEENGIFTDEEDVYIAMSPLNKKTLILEAEAAGSSYWAAEVMDWSKKKSSTLFGAHVRVTPQAPVAGGFDKVTVFSGSRGFAGTFGGLQCFIDRDFTRQHAWMVSCYLSLGVIRRFENAVVTINADDQVV